MAGPELAGAPSDCCCAFCLLSAAGRGSDDFAAPELSWTYAGRAGARKGGGGGGGGGSRPEEAPSEAPRDGDAASEARGRKIAQGWMANLVRR